MRTCAKTHTHIRYLIDNQFRGGAVIEVSIVDSQWIQVGYVVATDLVGPNQSLQ